MFKRIFVRQSHFAMMFAFLFSVAPTAVGQVGQTQEGVSSVPKRHTLAVGPLRVHPKNPRYFTDGTKDQQGNEKAVYLTGSHSWDSMRDWEPVKFDFERYLEFLQKNNHNFIRLWAWDLPKFDATGQWELRAESVTPFPWMRTGPGIAADGKPKFDLKKFDPAYFDRLRARVKTAGAQGVYVSIMLFEGWSANNLKHAKSRNTHPFVGSNNVNDIDLSDNAIYSLDNQDGVDIQDAYVRKVIDTVGDLDNVLYEISNETHPGSTAWQYHMIDLIHEVEMAKSKQHPVGMTHFGGKNPNKPLLESPADWISPGSKKYYNDPPAGDGHQVIITDSDHLMPACADPAWVWKSFCRGLNVILMDCFTIDVYGTYDRATHEGNDLCRKAMGHTKSLADRINLADTSPQGKLSSTGYCLANPGVEYVIFLPKGGKVDVDLSDAPKKLFQVEWIHPTRGTRTSAEPVRGGEKQTLQALFLGPAVLFLRAQ